MKNSVFNGPKVIMFNGPKGSGKDSAAMYAQIHVLHSTSMHTKMAHPLYNAIQYLFGLEIDQWEYLYNNMKETPLPLLNGMSPREALIWLSEEVVKPKFGSEFFGKIAGRTCLNFFEQENDGIVLMSDAGFNDEVRELVGMVGSERCYLIRLCDGNDFSGDSREYVDPNYVGIDIPNFFTIYNTGSLAEFRESVKLVVQCIESRRNE